MTKQRLVRIGFCSILLLESFLVTAREVCSGFLQPSHSEFSDLSTTKRFLVYLGSLKSKEILGVNELKLLVNGIHNQRKIINIVPHLMISSEPVFENSSYQIHYKTIEAYLNHVELNQEEVLKWALNTISNTEQVRKQKDQVNEKTQPPFVQMQFHPVAKGEFDRGEPGKKVHTILTHDIEVMSTPVTQWMWTSEMGANPSHIVDGAHSMLVHINGKQIKMYPDNPVDNVNWYMAAMFANHMSRKHGLKEVYDFSAMKMREGTRMEDGSLIMEGGEVKINGPSIYETEGYRLPTEAEQEYLLTDRGRSTTEYFTGITRSNIKDYVWFVENSSTRENSWYFNTYPVGEKKALMVDGKAFHDLYGNALEWSHDLCGVKDDQSKGGVNPVSKCTDWTMPFGALRGGHAGSNLDELASYRDVTDEALCSFYEDTHYSYSFRLVRTIK